jgi:outer membrane protein OmpU
MKHTLLATTALIAMTGAAAAELTISGSGRLGLVSTEGHAAADAVLKYGTVTSTMISTFGVLGTKLAKATEIVVHNYNITTTTNALGLAGSTVLKGDITELDAMILEAEARINHSTKTTGATSGALATALTDTAPELAQITTDLATMKSLRAQMVQTTTAAKTLTADTTSAANRFRISFSGSGETDSGISYGISGRAEQSDSTTSGSQYISGAFGKISMGDLDGADEVAAGGGVAGVGLSGLGDLNDTKYQSSGHNLGYQFSASGFTFAYSQDTTVTAGSNSAMGLKYSGDMGGATLTIGLGQSDVGTKSQTTVSAAVSSGGLTVKAATSTNDNGPAVKALNGTARSGDGTTAYKADIVAAANNDTDQTSVSVSYAMDAMSVTAFSRTVSTSGSADLDYSGFGFTYDLGGATLKAGVVDNNDKSVMDLGVTFSF